MKRISTLTLISISCFAAHVHAQALRGVGSDLLGPDLQASIIAALSTDGFSAELNFAGSLHGWQTIDKGEADFAIVAASDSVPVNRNLPQYTVAFQVAKIAVHTSNPVQSLNYSQLTALYGLGGATNDWRALTNDPTWANRPVALHAYRSDQSMTLEIFSAVVIQNDDLKREMRFNDNLTSLTAVFVQSPGALTLMPAIEEGRNFRFIAVQAPDQAQAYSPSPDNVLFGDYRLRMPFYLVFSANLPEGTRNSLLRAIFSEPVLDAFEAAYFMPVPATERDAILQHAR